MWTTNKILMWGEKLVLFVIANYSATYSRKSYNMPSRVSMIQKKVTAFAVKI